MYNLGDTPASYDFDHSFLSPALCCNPGIYFENGVGSPGTKYAIQRLYSPDFPKYPVFKPPFYDFEHTDTPIFKRDHPRNILVAEDFDSRDVEPITAEKVYEFIDSQAGSEKPFFLYYAARLGHSPFNAPESYRNKTAAGISGEHIMMTDEIVGNIMNRLKRNGMDDNTIVVFTSDNGSDDGRQSFKFLKSFFFDFHKKILFTIFT